MTHRVLVVDDDAAVRAVTCECLRADGQEVYSASDGEEALAAMHCGPLPELVVLDLMMPRKTGWEVLECMGNDARLATVPVVVLTSLDSRDGLPFGPPTLHKPVDVELLLDLVHTVLARHDAFVDGIASSQRPI